MQKIMKKRVGILLPILLLTALMALAQTFERNIVKTRQQPESVKQLDGGSVLADFGRDAFGQVIVTIDSKTAGDSLVMHLGECLKDGRIDRNPGGSRRYLRLAVALQKGKQTYQPVIPNDKRNTKRGTAQVPDGVGQVLPFRYVEVEAPGSGFRVQGSGFKVSRDIVHVKFNDETAMFHCDDEALNKVWDLCKYSIKATSFTGYYIDGDRERIPYEADALINQLSHYAVDSEYNMARRTFEWLVKHPTWPTEWMPQWVLIAWNDYLWTGNTDLLKRYEQDLLAHTLIGLRNDTTGLVTTRRGMQTPEFLKSIHRKAALKDIVDWPHGKRKKDKQGNERIVGGEDDGYDYRDYNTVVNAYHYAAISRMAAIYAAIDKKEESKKMKKESEKFYTLFNKAFFDSKRGYYVDGMEADGNKSDHSSLHANMFALCFELVPEAHKQTVTDFVMSRGMACSVYGSQFLLDALYEGHHDEAALQLMTSDGERGWLNMLREGSTITMEAWGNKFKGNQDWNHAWGAAPANIIPLRLMGVRPTEPGYKRCEIRPQTATLKEADCRVPTPHGGIGVSVRRTDSSYTLTVDIPQAIKADIILPESYKGWKMTLDGKVVKAIAQLSGKHTIVLKK